MTYADLHLHTAFSDSTYSPEALVAAAKKAGLGCIAVVDHDTVAGIRPSLEAGENGGVEVLPGIELTAEYQGLEVHILGYLIDCQNAALIEQLENLKNIRVERIHQMVAKLQKLGMELEADDVFSLAGQGTVGRLHLARAMVKKGLVRSTGEAFARFIGEKGPGYVLGFRLAPKEAVELIKKAKGVPVLAHPYSLNRDELIPELINCGVMGLEVYYPEHTPSKREAYTAMAEKYHLLMTGGSDCHGSAKPEVKIGSIKVPYALVEKIKSAQQHL
jgi:predicted metal-dependent phosphoesterase TrpH